jgi:hypothetical protein
MLPPCRSIQLLNRNKRAKRSKRVPVGIGGSREVHRDIKGLDAMTDGFNCLLGAVLVQPPCVGQGQTHQMQPGALPQDAPRTGVFVEARHVVNASRACLQQDRYRVPAMPTHYRRGGMIAGHHQNLRFECRHLRHQTIHGFERLHFGVEIGVFATAIRVFGRVPVLCGKFHSRRIR